MFWLSLDEARQFYSIPKTFRSWIGRGRLNETTGLLVLVRTDAGSLFAVEDRFAHRQVPLHLGVVEGEQLRCCYHGWCYDSKGRLVRIPYLADGGKLPPDARGVRSYPCREAYGLIFIFPGAREMAGRAPLPEVAEFSSRDYRTMYFSREVKCHYTFMHENLMDMNHQFREYVLNAIRGIGARVKGKHGN